MEILNSLMEIPWVRERSSIFLRAKILVIFLTSRRDVVAVCAISRLFNVLALYVEKEHRGRGVGKRILTKAINEARKQGLSFIFLSVYARNVPALRLYSKLGFKNIFNLKQREYCVMMLPLKYRGKIICYAFFITLNVMPTVVLFYTTRFIEKVLAEGLI